MQVTQLPVLGTGSTIGGMTEEQAAAAAARAAEIAANREAAKEAAAQRAAAAAAANGNGNGNGIGPAATGAFQVPNNFWGFVMLTMGLK